MAYIKDNELLRLLQRKMKPLREDGLFLPQKRAVAGGTRYLIVSYGGAGAQALYEIRRTLKEALSPADYRAFFRFLAVDSDRNTHRLIRQMPMPDGMIQTVVDDTLEQSEFCWLDPYPARSLARLRPLEVGKWMHPDLLCRLMEPCYLDGTGASASRPIGRLLLQSEQVVQQLRTMIIAHVLDLARDNNDEVQILVITGISGGTGSGIVVDASYLIRDAAESLHSSLPRRVRMDGFLLLPPAVEDMTGFRAENGNCTAYAAMKEINHFMTLTDRGECYEQDYGLNQVRSCRNLFDSCTLLDGGKNVSVGQRQKRVVRMLADFVLDKATSRPIPNGNAPGHLGTGLTPDPMAAMAMLGNKRPEDAPRDTDYIYSTMGHATVDFPLEEIKTYVAQKLFERVCKYYQFRADVDLPEAKAFVKEVKSAGASWRHKVEEILNSRFTDPECGPFYVVNLLREAIPVIKEMQGRLFANRERLQEIEKYLAALLNIYFTVFAEVLEEMKNTLDGQNHMVCQGTSLRKTRFDTDYAFCLISLAAGSEPNAPIRDYLSELITNSCTLSCAKELAETMLANRAAWARLDRGSAFDAPAQIRSFWEKEIDRIVNATVEDLLVKLYAGDKRAKYDREDPGFDRALEQAAQYIYRCMFGNDGLTVPALDVRTGWGMQLSDFASEYYLLVPESMPNLTGKLQSIAAAQGGHVHVMASTGIDRICGYSCVTNLPGWMLWWTELGARAYGRLREKPGLHREEASDGKNWREAPGLLPVSTWRFFPGFEDPQEKKMAEKASALFKRARTLGLTDTTPAIAAPALQYTLWVLPKELRPEESLFRKYALRDVPNVGTETLRDRDRLAETIRAQAHDIARRLCEEAGGDASEGLRRMMDAYLTPVRLWTPSLQMYAPVLPDGWDEMVAISQLRRQPETLAALEGTLAVVDRLEMLLSSPEDVPQF